MKSMLKQEEEILASIDEREIVALLQDLIRSRSDNPPGDCRAAIQVVKTKLAEAGIEYEIFSQQDHKPNLLAQIYSGIEKKRLIYHAHIDTVSSGNVDNWSFDPFSGQIHNEAVYGRGAGDDKGSVASQVMAMVTLARAGIPLTCSLQLAIVADEESGGQQGTHFLCDSGKLKPDALVIGEQTNNEIAIAERVACGIDLIVFGKGAHGAMPWAGDNAILKTARVLEWLVSHYFPLLAAKCHPYLPPATLNIGRISGGIQWNIVPDFCKVEMDRRLLPGESRDEEMQVIRNILDAYAENVEPLHYELFSAGEVTANVNTSPNHPFVITGSEALFAINNEKIKLTGYMQTSDGRWFARDNIPIIIFGPGDPSLAHANDEYVPIKHLVEAARFLTLLALRWPQ